MVFDINVTSRCNLACTYCSEGNECGLSSIQSANTQVDVFDLYKFIDKFPEEETFELFFWGGEPMLNWAYCKEVIDHYIDDKRFGFYFYTNGMYIDRYWDDILELHKKTKYQNHGGKGRLHFQISYDGDPINEIERIDKKGKTVSWKVKENYEKLRQEGISTSLKSVIVARSFKHIYEAYLDVSAINFNYSPTPDSFSQMTEEEFQPFLDELGEGLKNIAKHIYDNNLPPETFAWFQDSKKLCGAGKGYYSIDLNGDLSPCHGCMYRDTDTHKVGNVNEILADDINIKDYLETVSQAYKEGHHKTNECLSCDALYCLKCPVGCFDKSDKGQSDKANDELRFTDPEYFEKWSDANANWQMCKVFKLSDKYHKALRYALNLRAQKLQNVK